MGDDDLRQIRDLDPQCSVPGCGQPGSYGYVMDREQQIHPVCERDWRQYRGSPYFPEADQWPK